jgi:hypothetical protein
MSFLLGAICIASFGLNPFSELRVSAVALRNIAVPVNFAIVDKLA